MKGSLYGIVVTTYEHESECSIHDQDEDWMMLREVSNSLLMLVSKWAKCRSKPYMIAIRKERKKKEFCKNFKMVYSRKSSVLVDEDSQFDFCGWILS